MPSTHASRNISRDDRRAGTVCNQSSVPDVQLGHSLSGLWYEGGEEGFEENPGRPHDGHSVRRHQHRCHRSLWSFSCWFILLSVGVLTCLRRHTHTSHISLQHLIHPLQQTSGPVCRLATRPDPGLSASSFQKHSVFSQCAAFSWSFIKCRKKWTREKNDEFLTGFRFGFLFWFCWFSGGCSWLGSGTCTLLLKGNQPTVCLEDKAGNSWVTRKS